jgi:hypothetical protein
MAGTALKMATSLNHIRPPKQIPSPKLMDINQENEVLRARLRAAVLGLPIFWFCLIVLLHLELPFYISILPWCVMLFIIVSQSYALLYFPMM